MLTKRGAVHAHHEEEYDELDLGAPRQEDHGEEDDALDDSAGPEDLLPTDAVD